MALGSGAAESATTSLSAAWRRATGDVGALLVFLLLPIALSHHLPAILMHVPLSGLGPQIGFLIVVCAVIAAAYGTIVTAGAAALARSPAVARWWTALTFWLALIVLMICALPYGLAWLAGMRAALQAAGYPRMTALFRPALLEGTLLLALLWLLRRPVRNAEALSARLRGAHVTLLVVVSVSALTAGISGLFALRPFGWSLSGARDSAAGTAMATAGTPDVLLITIDTLAAQDMSLHGYRLPTTPELDRFAQSSYVFDRFYATSNWTLPAVVSIATGRYPTTHRTSVMHSKLPRDQRDGNIGALLRARGYVTAAVTTNPNASPLNFGIGSSFDYISASQTDRDWRNATASLAVFHRAVLPPVMLQEWFAPLVLLTTPLRSIPAVAPNPYPAQRPIDVAEAVRRSVKQPLFLWSHFLSPHDPYLPDDPFRGRFLPGDEFRHSTDFGSTGPYDVATQQAKVDRMRLRYDEFVAYTDAAVGGWLRALEHSGALEHTLVIITADHGESFERGWRGHAGHLLHPALTWIPLIIHLPGQKQGARIAQIADQTDLLPTLLDLLGAPIPAAIEGSSLVPAMREGQVVDGSPTYSFDLQRTSRFGPPTAGSFAVILGDRKLVHQLPSGCEALYDLAADPREQRNVIADANPAAVASMRARLSQKTGATLKPAGLHADSDPRCAVHWSEGGGAAHDND